MLLTWKNATVVERRLFRGICILAGGHKALVGLLFNPKAPQLRDRPGVIRDDSWHLSHEEMLLVQAALDIWSGSGHLALWDCLETWDEENWIRFIAAVGVVKNIDLRAAVTLQESVEVASPDITDSTEF
jgi:hypothetical protein